MIGDLANTVAHRPWSLPQGPWVMVQSWRDLLFAHWPVSLTMLRGLVPPQLHLDTYDGCAWVGVVPFRMSNVRPRWLPAVPWLSAFPELNVRTYVRSKDPANPRPGVYFFSLDAGNPIAVWLARTFFKLPYFRAQMRLRDAGGVIHYTSQRTHRNAAPAEFAAAYAPSGGVTSAAPGSLEWWLTERYSLYTVDYRGRLYIGEIHHLPWPLQPAQAEIRSNRMAEAGGIELPDTAPLLHFVRRLDVLIWPLHPIVDPM